MAPSSFKTVRGSKGNKEGNHASFSKSQKGRSMNNDLGLTLLPGSQTQEDDQDTINAPLRQETQDISRSIRNCQKRTFQRNGDNKTSIKSGTLNNQHVSPSQPTSSRIRPAEEVARSSKLQDAQKLSTGHASRSSFVHGAGSRDAPYRSATASNSEILAVSAKPSQTLVSSDLLNNIALSCAQRGRNLGSWSSASRSNYTGTNHGNACKVLRSLCEHRRSASAPVNSGDESYLEAHDPLQKVAHSFVGIPKHVSKVSGKVSKSWTRHFPAGPTKSHSGGVTSPPISSNSLAPGIFVHKKHTFVTTGEQTSSLSNRHDSQQAAFGSRGRSPKLRASSPQGHEGLRAKLSIPTLAIEQISSYRHFRHYNPRSCSLPNLHTLYRTTIMDSLPVEHQLLTPPSEAQCPPFQERADDLVCDYGQDNFEYQYEQTLISRASPASHITHHDSGNILPPPNELSGNAPQIMPRMAVSSNFNNHVNRESVSNNLSLPSTSSATQQPSVATSSLERQHTTAQVQRQMQVLHANGEKQVQGLREHLQTTERNLQALSSTHERLNEAYHIQETQNSALKDRLMTAERANRELQKQLIFVHKSNTAVSEKYDELVKQMQAQVHKATTETRPQFGDFGAPRASTGPVYGLPFNSYQHQTGHALENRRAQALNEPVPFAGNDPRNSFLFPSPAQTQSALSMTPNLSQPNDGSVFESHGSQTVATSVTPSEPLAKNPTNMTFDQLSASLDFMFSDDHLAAIFDGQNCGIAAPRGFMITGSAGQTIDLTKDSLNKDSTPSLDTSTHSRRPSAHSHCSSAHTRVSSLSEVEKTEKKKVSSQVWRDNAKRKRDLACMHGEDSEEYRREVALLKTATGRESRTRSDSKKLRSRSNAVEKTAKVDLPQAVAERNGIETQHVGGAMEPIMEHNSVNSGSVPEDTELDEAALAEILEAEMMKM